MKNYFTSKAAGILMAAAFTGCTLSAGAQSALQDTLRRAAGEAGTVYEPGPLLRISKERSITSNSNTTGEVLGKMPVANLTNTLYGRLNGLMVTQNNGQPGYDQASLFMRGRGTYDQPGIVCFVDGFQVDISFYFQYLAAGEIESITLLKDPVSLATFGMKGANGILWVTTKRAGSGKFKVDAQLITGIQQATNIRKPYDAYNYARLYNQAISNDNYALNGNKYIWSPAYSDAQLQDYKDGKATNVDWFSEALKKSAAFTDANVNIQGGISETARYNLFVDYMSQTGLYNAPKDGELGSNTGLRRFTLRSNIDLRFFKIFEGRVDLGGRIENYQYPFSNNTYDNAQAYWRQLSTYPNNIYPVKDPATGNWSGNTLYPNNPVAQLNATGIYTSHDRTLQGNFSLKEDLGFITPGFYLSQSVSFNTWSRVIQNKTATYARFYEGQQATADRTTQINFGVNTPYGQLTWRQSNLMAGYDRTFNDHAITAAVNYYASDMIPDANQDPSRISYHFQNIGGRANYTYKGKYIGEIGWGYSGSDNYAGGNRWKFYPAVSLGWIVSDESFLQDNSWISHLKLRAAAGKSGNDQTNQGRYLYQQYYRYVPGSITGNNSLNYNNGLSLGRLASPDITAEESLKYEAGFDLALLKKLNINATWFLDKRSGIISRNNLIPGYLGYTGSDMLPLQNIGKVTNRGIEMAISYADKVGDLQYALDLMGAYASNKIDYQAEIPNKNNFSNTTGRPVGSPMGLVAAGFYQLEDFNADGTLKAGVPVPGFGPVQPGDLKYQDLDKNGVIDNTDITRIGNPGYPSFYYSFNLAFTYKNFDLSALFQGASGLSVNLLGSAYNQVVPFAGNTTIYPIAGNAWAYYPDQQIDTRNTANFPRLTTMSNTNNYTNSTFWMKDASFLKLRSLQLGYNLPASLIKNLHLTKLRVFATAVNPVIWSSFYKEYKLDPEAPAGYPGIKSFNAGVSLSF
ncbi:SusC/RagA family TonB-linked outer membrane protein [Pseudobacter ginsenosidimutans]|uniref:TonB-linked SusC/RagA family outer membrane protein n=1 Tax=Pseudobacter ginsenosidimutans TaxID=661488 RepID=A0A4Q7N1H6_9BACT|nr:SusC/RagA family TonB-linked outer membrane protein [Pseudobacter ginsenosidimutans]QEC43111.1 SusC/RagA family TonB-linked outer membrane protein [Pseudobacter ginsenosidimutans]RZS74469.1 TonB-linked SusC/RagA family outer membrane protein [Pseudobacter ginsenosidimutans]